MEKFFGQVTRVFALLALAAVPSLVAAGPSEVVELQVNVCDKIGTVLTNLELESGDAAKRDTYLFESEKLELIDAHVTVRLRIEDEGPELAVKLSDLSTGDMVRWQKLGAECEYDDHFDSETRKLLGACKVLKMLDDKELRGLKSRKLHVSEVLSPKQLELVAAHKTAVANIRILGPLKDRVWKTKEEGFDKKLTLEESVAPTGRSFIEISTRGTVGSQERTAKKLKAFLEENEITLCTEQTGQRRKKLVELFK